MTRETSADAYGATAGTYDLFAAADRPRVLTALDALLPRLLPQAGPVLDVGAGSGLNLAVLLDHISDVRVVALEPSPAMRALALAKVAANPTWFERVTVRPEDFFSASLPDVIGGALLLGVIGHFDPGERAAVLAELAARLPDNGVALVDLRSPERPCRIEPDEFTAAQIGELTYRGIDEAWPVDTELMRWRTTRLTLEGERVLIEDTAEHEYRHPAPGIVAAEAEQVGLRMEPAGEGGFWLLTRIGR